MLVFFACNESNQRTVAVQRRVIRNTAAEQRLRRAVAFLRERSEPFGDQVPRRARFASDAQRGLELSWATAPSSTWT